MKPKKYEEHIRVMKSIGCWLHMVLLEVLFLGGMLGGVAGKPEADTWRVWLRDQTPPKAKMEISGFW